MSHSAVGNNFNGWPLKAITTVVLHEKVVFRNCTLSTEKREEKYGRDKLNDCFTFHLFLLQVDQKSTPQGSVKDESVTSSTIDNKAKFVIPPAKKDVSRTKSDSPQVDLNGPCKESQPAGLTRSAPELLQSDGNETMDYSEIKNLMKRKFDGLDIAESDQSTDRKGATSAQTNGSFEKKPCVGSPTLTSLPGDPDRGSPRHCARVRHRSDGSLSHLNESKDVLDSVQEILIEEDREWRRVSSKLLNYRILSGENFWSPANVTHTYEHSE